MSSKAASPQITLISKIQSCSGACRCVCNRFYTTSDQATGEHLLGRLITKHWSFFSTIWLSRKFFGILLWTYSISFFLTYLVWVEYMHLYDLSWTWPATSVEKKTRQRFAFTRPKPTYGRQGLDWIVGPGYSFCCSQCPASHLRRSARLLIQKCYVINRGAQRLIPNMTNSYHCGWLHENQLQEMDQNWNRRYLPCHILHK